MSEDQLATLPVLLDHGAETHGFQGNHWTCARVGALMEQEFGVHYHPSHVSRILRKLGVTLKNGQARRNLGSDHPGPGPEETEAVSLSDREDRSAG